LAIARCLMGQPDLIMFDEPSLGLAPALVQDLFRTIRSISQGGLTVILVEQNVAASLKLASRAYVLENARVVSSGSGAALLGDDRLRQASLGVGYLFCSSQRRGRGFAQLRQQARLAGLGGLVVAQLDMTEAFDFQGQRGERNRRRVRLRR